MMKLKRLQDYSFVTDEMISVIMSNKTCCCVSSNKRDGCYVITKHNFIFYFTYRLFQGNKNNYINLAKITMVSGGLKLVHL